MIVDIVPETMTLDQLTAMVERQDEANKAQNGIFQAALSTIVKAKAFNEIEPTENVDAPNGFSKHVAKHSINMTKIKRIK